MKLKVNEQFANAPALKCSKSFLSPSNLQNSFKVLTAFFPFLSAVLKVLLLFLKRISSSVSVPLLVP